MTIRIRPILIDFELAFKYFPNFKMNNAISNEFKLIYDRL